MIVGGPLCESGDIFTQEEGGFVSPRRLPEAKVGDLLVIECAGAYGFVMGSNYNSQPLAAEVLIDAGRARLIRRRQTFEDLIRGEEIPPQRSRHTPCAVAGRRTGCRPVPPKQMEGRWWQDCHPGESLCPHRQNSRLTYYVIPPTTGQNGRRMLFYRHGVAEVRSPVTCSGVLVMSRFPLFMPRLGVFC